MSWLAPLIGAFILVGFGWIFLEIAAENDQLHRTGKITFWVIFSLILAGAVHR